MNRSIGLLRSSLATALALTALALLMGCLDKPAAVARVAVTGDSITFPAYTIKEGELDAPAQGPYTRFHGAYPTHWPKEWRLDERFFIPGGGFAESLKSINDTDAVTFEFDGVFAGSPAVLEQWFRDQLRAVGVEITASQLSPTFNVIERRKLDLPSVAWSEAGLTGEMLLSYGPRYADYTHFTFVIAKYLRGAIAAPAASPVSPPSVVDTHPSH